MRIKHYLCHIWSALSYKGGRTDGVFLTGIEVNEATTYEGT